MKLLEKKAKKYLMYLGIALVLVFLLFSSSSPFVVGGFIVGSTQSYGLSEFPSFDEFMDLLNGTSEWIYDQFMNEAPSDDDRILFGGDEVIEGEDINPYGGSCVSMQCPTDYACDPVSLNCIRVKCPAPTESSWFDVGCFAGSLRQERSVLIYNPPPECPFKIITEFQSIEDAVCKLCPTGECTKWEKVGTATNTNQDKLQRICTVYKGTECSMHKEVETRYVPIGFMPDLTNDVFLKENLFSLMFIAIIILMVLIAVWLILWKKGIIGR